MRVNDLRAFIANASAIIKAAAPNQLVCTGMEGDTAWFSRGQATVLTQQNSKIDFVTVRSGSERCHNIHQLHVSGIETHAPAPIEVVFVHLRLADSTSWSTKIGIVCLTMRPAPELTLRKPNRCRRRTFGL